MIWELVSILNSEVMHFTIIKFNFDIKEIKQKLTAKGGKSNKIFPNLEIAVDIGWSDEIRSLIIWNKACCTRSRNIDRTRDESWLKPGASEIDLNDWLKLETFNKTVKETQNELIIIEKPV